MSDEEKAELARMVEETVMFALDAGQKCAIGHEPSTLKAAGNAINESQDRLVLFVWKSADAAYARGRAEGLRQAAWIAEGYGESRPPMRNGQQYQDRYLGECAASSGIAHLIRALAKKDGGA